MPDPNSQAPAAGAGKGKGKGKGKAAAKRKQAPKAAPSALPKAKKPRRAAEPQTPRSVHDDEDVEDDAIGSQQIAARRGGGGTQVPGSIPSHTRSVLSRRSQHEIRRL